MRRNSIGVSRARQGLALAAVGAAAIGCQPDASAGPDSRGSATTVNAARVTGLVRTTIIPGTTSTAPGAVWGRAWAINEAGVVAGDRFVIAGATVPFSHEVFLWKDGEFTFYPSDIFPVAINRRLEMAGNSSAFGVPYERFTGPGTTNRALYWKDGVVTDIGTLGGAASIATDINEKGQIVGSSHTASGAAHAFIWDDGVMTDIGTLGGTGSIAHGINNHGQVVGVSTTASGDNHGFLWEKGTITDLGVLQGTTSGAFAINDKGEIAGIARGLHPACGTTVVSLPVVWRRGVIETIVLGPPINCIGGPLRVRDISDAGHVLGTFAHTSTFGWMWRDGVQVQLGGGGDTGVFQVNASGETAGYTLVSVGFGAASVWSVGRHGP